MQKLGLCVVVALSLAVVRVALAEVPIPHPCDQKPRKFCSTLGIRVRGRIPENEVMQIAGVLELGPNERILSMEKRSRNTVLVETGVSQDDSRFYLEGSNYTLVRTGRNWSVVSISSWIT